MVFCFLYLCPQGTTSFDRLRSTSFRAKKEHPKKARTQNGVVLHTNDAMLRINYAAHYAQPITSNKNAPKESSERFL